MTMQHSNGTLTKLLKLTPLPRQYPYLILTAFHGTILQHIRFVANDRQEVYWKASVELLATVTRLCYTLNGEKIFTSLCSFFLTFATFQQTELS